MSTTTFKTGYALSGGFIKGFAHLGMIQALHEAGIRPDILSGVSAGSVVSVFYADGKEPHEVVDLFETLSFKDLTSLSINRKGLLVLDDFIEFLSSNLSVKNLEELKTPVVVTATDLDHGCSVSFRSGNIAERVAASCSLPVLFTPQNIEGTWYVDGGVLMNFPVSVIREECDKIIGLNVSPLITDEYNQSILSIAQRAYHFMFQANAISEKRKCDLLIETNGLQDYSNHELEKVEEIFLKGYNAANDILYALKQENRTIWNTPL